MEDLSKQKHSYDLFQTQYNDNNTTNNSETTTTNADTFDMFSQIENGNINIKATVDGIGDKNANPGYGGFDSMLEALPDDITFDTFFHDGLYINSSNSLQNNLNGNNHVLEDVGHAGTRSKPTTEFSLFKHITTTQPIDITSNFNNLQNGEVPQLWDFTTETFQMTPSNSSDSATISAPNSFNSESNRSIPFASRFNNNNNFNNTITNKVLHGSSYSNQNFMSLLHQNSPNQHNNNNINNSNNTSNNILHMVSNYPSAYNNNNNNSPLNSFNDNKDKDRNDTVANKSISIPLTINNTTNSIRKSQSFARQLSSTSLSNLNVKRNSSISELSTSSNIGSVGVKKPPIQCYNCKTFKTPLWRRDANGNTLCNACGLFQKLHGTMRPLSLKTDVIKKRNSKKRIKRNQEMVLDNSNSTGNNIHNSNSNIGLNGKSRRNNETLLTNLANSSIAKNIVPKSIVQPTATTAMTATTTTDSNLSDKTFSITDHSLLTTTATTAMSTTNSNSTATKMISSMKNGTASNKSNSAAISHMNTTNSNGIAGNRRSSTSSNTSSRSSSSRPMVPILPKPSTSSSNSVPFNTLPHTYGSLSSSTSASSSPRYVAHYPGNNNNTLINGLPMNSNGSVNQGASPLQVSTFSTSVGRYISSPAATSTGSTNNNGINISRRRNSRNASHSSSFVANSLHNLQNMQQQQSSANEYYRVASPNISTSWNSHSNKVTRMASSNKFDSSNKNQQKKFETLNTNKETQQNSNSLSHTSLLSQQLQQNRVTIPIQPIPPSSHLQHMEKSVPMSLSNQNSPVIRNRPSIGQITSTLSHNANTHNNNMTNSYSESVQFQRHGSLQQQQQQQSISSYQSAVFSPLYQDSSQLRQEEQGLETPKTTKTMQEKVEDELEWLKFGI